MFIAMRICNKRFNSDIFINIKEERNRITCCTRKINYAMSGA